MTRRDLNLLLPLLAGAAAMAKDKKKYPLRAAVLDRQVDRCREVGARVDQAAAGVAGVGVGVDRGPCGTGGIGAVGSGCWTGAGGGWGAGAATTGGAAGAGAA